MSDETDEEVLGTTTVTQRWRISLIKAVREEFADAGDEVAEGDRLVFKIKDGEIIIEPT